MPDLDRLLHDRLGELTPTSAPDAADLHRDARRRRTRRRSLVATGAAVVVVAAGALVVRVAATDEPVDRAVGATPDRTSPITSATTSPATPPAVSTERRGPLRSGAAASCVESYSPQATTGRAFAFDGTVTSIGPSVSDRPGSAALGLPGVTFRVEHWFAGGSGDGITVDLQAPESAYEVGTRLLVSGEDRWDEAAPLDHPIAWMCGFTRYWDVETAASWEDAFAR